MRSARLLLVPIGLVVSTFALAQQGGLQGPCVSDVKTLCGAIQPGGGRIRDCMKQHRMQLSDACKLAIAERMLEHGGGHGGALVRAAPAPAQSTVP